MVINSITTILLCVLTGIYVILTYKILRYQKQQFEIANRPYFSFDFFELAINQENGFIKSLQPKLHFKNIGNVLLEYSIIKNEFTVNDVIGNNNSLSNKGGIVFPKMDAIFFFPNETTFNSKTLRDINDCIVRYELAYKIPGSNILYHSKKTLVFQFESKENKIFGIIFEDAFES